QLERKWGRVLLRGRTRQRPDLSEPLVEPFLIDHAEPPLPLRRLAVTTWLALHEDELDVVLDDRVRLIRFAEELRPVIDLKLSVRDLVPEDRIQVVESDFPAADGDVRV